MTVRYSASLCVGIDQAITDVGSDEALARERVKTIALQFPGKEISLYRVTTELLVSYTNTATEVNRPDAAGSK